jgi:predicted nuclease of restriction endonuclease-like (RecB) superfamily
MKAPFYGTIQRLVRNNSRKLPLPRQLSFLPDDYDEFLHLLKERIRTAQLRAVLSVNRELILLYWYIGREILHRQRQEGWGAKVIERLAKDLKRDFPQMKGFSRSNLTYMRAFAEAYPDEQFVQQVVGQIPWGHNVRLLDMVKDPEVRLWYACKAIEYGWSRNVLIHQIESDLHQRQGSAITNFAQTLPPSQSDLAQSLIKDPYTMDFITLREGALERELEQALVSHMREFLLELGVGFSFMGNQFPIVVDGKEYKIDLLFYHVKLRCYIVIELKMGDFEPAYSGQMNFYVSAVDDLLRHPDDQPTIGLILCRSKSKTTVEYALRNVSTPIGVSTHRVPDQFRSTLPSIEELEQELESAATALEAEIDVDPS